MLVAPYILVFVALRRSIRSLRVLAGAHPQSYVQALRRPDLPPLGRATRSCSSSSRERQDGARAVPVRVLHPRARWWIRWLSVLFILPWAVPSIPTILSFRFMLNPEWGMINSLIFRLTGAGRAELAQRPLARLRLAMRGPHLEVAAVLDPDPDRRPARDPEGHLRSRVRRRREPAGSSSATSPGRRCRRST